MFQHTWPFWLQKWKYNTLCDVDEENLTWIAKALLGNDSINIETSKRT
jgi:hypothetical protein